MSQVPSHSNNWWVHRSQEIAQSSKLTLLTHVAKYLTKATQGRKVSHGSQFESAQSIVVEKAEWLEQEATTHISPIREHRGMSAGTQQAFSFNYQSRVSAHGMVLLIVIMGLLH